MESLEKAGQTNEGKSMTSLWNCFHKFQFRKSISENHTVSALWSVGRSCEKDFLRVIFANWKML
jgi:hypothetical protein